MGKQDGYGGYRSLKKSLQKMIKKFLKTKIIKK
jgi:hypothetical protein